MAMRALTKKQVTALFELVKNKEWFPGCGFYWKNYSTTIRMMDALVRHGVAVEIGENSYRPHPNAKAVLSIHYSKTTLDSL